MGDIEIDIERLQDLLDSGEIDVSEYNRQLKEIEEFYDTEEECPMCGNAH